MAEKVTYMVLKVDLQCPSCYKKIKKILCKFPEIRDQVYDKKQNLVKITVVCCSPNKVRDKLCCKGGKAIKSIDIVELPVPKPKEPEKPQKPKDPEKPKKVVIIEKPKDPEKPKVVVVVDKPKEPEKPKVVVVEKPKDPSKPAPPVVIPQPLPAEPIPVPAGPYPVPVGFCCVQCFDGYGGVPCYHGGYGYGRPVPPPPTPPPCYDNYGYGYSYGKGCYVSRCDYFSEENASACNIM